VRAGYAETPVGRFAAPGLPEGSAAIVAIRPQALRLNNGGEGVPGYLRQRKFLGHDDAVEVVTEGLDVPLAGRILRDAIPPINDDLRVEFDPAEVLVFAATEA
jgi:iron(III) transport system ATP-binding protein